MLRILFDNIVLVAVAFGFFTAGVFLSSQWLKDKLNGIPPELRKALKETEALAVRAVAHFSTTKAIPSTTMPTPPAAPAVASTIAPVTMPSVPQ
jgi:hypothetical protein